MKRNTKNNIFKTGLTAILLTAVISSTVCASGDPTGLVYSHKTNDKMMIALTFDDGPHPRYTPEILDILKEYDIRATFFAVGENIEAYPEVTKRCIAEGHEIANHTHTHEDLSKNSFDTVCREVITAQKTIYENLNYKTTLLRPPGGLYNKTVVNVAAKLDYTLVLWNIDTRDWAHTPSDKIADKVLSNIHPGDIILMHDYIAKNSPTPEALRKIIPALLEKGYKFVTVSELLDCP